MNKMLPEMWESWLEMEVRTHPRIMRVVAGLWYIAFYFLVMFVSLSLCYAITSDKTTVAVIGTLLSGLVALLMYAMRIRRMPWLPSVEIEHDRPWSWSVRICALVILFAVAWSVGESASTAVYAAMKDESFLEYSVAAESMTGDSAIGLVGICLSLTLVPMAEEAIFRGLCYEHLRRGIGPVLGMLVSSGLFALCHGTMVHLPITFLLGLAACIAIEVTGSLWGAILIHAGINAMAFVPGIVIPQAVIALAPIMYVCVVIILCILMHGVEAMSHEQ